MFVFSYPDLMSLGMINEGYSKLSKSSTPRVGNTGSYSLLLGFKVNPPNGFQVTGWHRQSFHSAAEIRVDYCTENI